MQKYKNVKTIVDNISFDSKKEAKRYQELKIRCLAGEIQNLRLQVKYIFNELRLPTVKKTKLGKVKKGRCPSYIADFVYDELSGDGFLYATVAEDTKGYFTNYSKIKIALMEYFYDIKVRII